MRSIHWFRLLVVAAMFTGMQAGAQTPGVAGAPYVPTPTSIADRLLTLANIGPKDYVIDLGSGDGRNVIAAAKRGARALGVEYDRELLALARKNAIEAGVGERARFVEGDMFEADISGATVLALFLLPDNLQRLKPKFSGLPRGTRIVTNGFPIDGWEAKEVDKVDGDCGSWCTAYLYVVGETVSPK